MTFKRIFIFIKKSTKYLVCSVGIFFLIAIILSFTPLPYWTRYWLGTSNSRYTFDPQYIIMLGGGSMPSEHNLMRLYFTNKLAIRYNDAKIIIAQPNYDNSNEVMMRYLTTMGLDSSNIFFEDKGLNTRMQALFIAEKFPETLKSNCLIVTSPEHMRRSILTFKKAGFDQIGGNSAFECNPTVDISINTDSLGGRKVILDFGFKTSIRYDTMNYLIHQIAVVREFAAIFYYWLKDWI